MRLIIWLTVGNASNESMMISCRVELECTPQAKQVWKCKVLIWDIIFSHFSSSCFQSQSSRQTFESHETVMHNVCKHLTCWSLACMTHWERMGTCTAPSLSLVYIITYEYICIPSKRKSSFASWQSSVWKRWDVTCSRGPSVASSLLAAILQTYCLSAGPHPGCGSATLTLCQLWLKEGGSWDTVGREEQTNCLRAWNGYVTKKGQIQNIKVSA